ncbi:hypothetical protein ABZW47_16265 [Streptomyces sp. NPDC004549]|uniref:hypothetical protein n=1 Tax=Streptomyces sp. NPDC004549 TaxID=3154283 RepID=UPI0033A50A1E
MTRTPPNAAELALATEVARSGWTATPHQFERWHAQGWLAPSRPVDRPATDSLRPETAGRAVWLAALSAPGRSIGWIGWMFWSIDESPQTAERLRHALAETLQHPLRRAGVTLAQIPYAGTDSAFTVRRELARALLDGRRAIGRELDGILRAHDAAEDVILPAPRSVSSPFATSLVEAGLAF